MVAADLLHDEKIIYRTRPHWVIFFPALIILLTAFLMAYYGGHYWRTYQIIALFTLTLGIFYFVKAFVYFYTTDYAITNHRVILKKGWIERNILEMFLRRLECINVNQTILGRLLDYGTLTVVGTGGTHDNYFNVPRPLFFRQLVQEQTERLLEMQNNPE